MRAIEQGIITRNTKEHLLELEAEEDRLVANIQAEEEKLPKISREMILFALHRFSNLNLSIAKNKERLIDGMVKAILLYDDRIVVYLTFKDEPITIPTADELRDMENSSDLFFVIHTLIEKEQTGTAEVPVCDYLWKMLMPQTFSWHTKQLPPWSKP